MAKNERIQKLFLVCMSSVYLIAFVSFFVQIPGLYGDNGILPVRLALKKGLRSTKDILLQQPTVLHFLHNFGFTDTQLNLNFITFFGIVISFASFVAEGFRNTWSYALLFVLYQSLVHVGQTFLWFQWDTLLLEVGLLTLLIAPLRLPFVNMDEASKHGRSVAFWLVKWLVFRLMFCSGVVKLNSECPTWWGLTALTIHYESQCLPTPLSWFFHHLPIPFHRFSNAMVFVIQIVSSILFFSPLKLHRTLSFVAQTSLMILILLTGNYNFFNLLSIFLLLSLLDDSSLPPSSPLKTPNDTPGSTTTLSGGGEGCKKRGKGVLCRVGGLLRTLTHVTVLGFLLFVTHSYFGVSFSLHPPYLHADIQFSLKEFHSWIHAFLPITIWVASLSLAVTILTALLRSVVMEGGVVRKFTNILSTIFLSSIVVVIFATSLVPYTEVDKGTQDKLPKPLFYWYNDINQYNIINSYGLFRSMTGVGGRPEVVVEGQAKMGGEWKEYEFPHKPGKLDRMPPIIAPHQPRLDWQMWFAALGSYQYNPWFFNMVYRLLNNQPEVLDLTASNPFQEHPPKAIRAQLYHYHYTPLHDSTANWWRREWVREYMPAVTLDNDYLQNYVSEAGLDAGKKGFQHRHSGSIASIFFNYLHAITPPIYAFHVCVASLLVGLTSLLLDYRLGTCQSKTEHLRKKKC